MLWVLVNPTAGSGYANRVGDEIAEALRQRGRSFELKRTECVGHATELAREAVRAGAHTVLAVGGDGTLLEIVRGLYGSDTALGIIPAGTGNDVIKMLDLPRKPMEALAFILEHPARRLDAGRINQSLFINVCGTGFDVMVLDNAMAAKKYVRGMLPYLWGVIRTIFTYKPVRLTVTVDDQPPVEHMLLLLGVANGRFIGGGMEVAPGARPDDGLFDLVMIDSMPRWKLPVQLFRLLRGKIREIPGTTYTTCRRVTMREEGMRVNIDGEIAPMREAEMEILPQALWVHW